jgi:hypothetical protein
MSYFCVQSLEVGSSKWKHVLKLRDINRNPGRGVREHRSIEDDIRENINTNCETVQLMRVNSANVLDEGLRIGGLMICNLYVPDCSLRIHTCRG